MGIKSSADEICLICGDPCDGKFHHMFCSSQWHKAWCEKYGVRGVDANGSYFTWEWVSQLPTASTCGVLSGWKGVVLKTHPCQKQIFNGSLVWLKKEKRDPLRRLAVFLDEVQWQTSEGIDPNIVQVFYKRKEILRIRQLQSWVGNQCTSSGWFAINPIRSMP